MKPYLLFILLLTSYFSFAQTEVAGTTFTNTIQIEGDEVSFSGAGVKKQLFTNVYTIGLYHNEFTTNAYKVIQSEKPMGINMQVLFRFLPRTKYITSLKEGFKRSTRSNFKPIKSEIDHFFSLLDEDLGRGDTLKFLYHPDTGVKVYTNGKLKGIVKGRKFKEALYSIWLGYPNDGHILRENLLGVDNHYASN